MRPIGRAAGSLVLLAVLAALAAVGLSAQGQQAQSAPPARPPAEDIGFASVESWTITPPDLTDAQVAGLLRTLDDLLARETDAAKWKSEAGIHFWRFQNRIERGRTTDAQRAAIAANFDRFAAKHPADKAYIDHRKWMALNLGIGRTVPDIAGKDLDGVQFSLTDKKD